MTRLAEFLQHGFLTFPAEAALARWAEAVAPLAAAAARDPAQAHWLRCGGTWFVGVDSLPNDETGRVPGGPPLRGAAVDFIRQELGLGLPLHRAQVSICYPGYPRPSPQETEAAFNFRLRRDAAHVDGLLAEGPEKRRYMREPHAYVLGVTLTAQSADASPLVVWEGSHHIMRGMFATAFANQPPGEWRNVDVTAPYQEARRRVFESCRRIPLPTGPGEAVLVHRHLVHGVALWGETAHAQPEGRMIAYFRPEFTRIEDWLSIP